MVTLMSIKCERILDQLLSSESQMGKSSFVKLFVRDVAHEGEVNDELGPKVEKLVATLESVIRCLHVLWCDKSREALCAVLTSARALADSTLAFSDCMKLAESPSNANLDCENLCDRIRPTLILRGVEERAHRSVGDILNMLHFGLPHIEDMLSSHLPELYSDSLLCLVAMRYMSEECRSEREIYPILLDIEVVLRWHTVAKHIRSEDGSGHDLERCYDLLCAHQE